MKKLVCLMKRRVGMAFEDFVEHYETKHVPLVLSFNPSARRYARRYVKPQENRLYSAEGESPYDVITEMWFDTQEEFDRGIGRIATDEAAAAIAADSEGLFDMSKAHFFTVADERFDDAHGADTRGTGVSELKGILLSERIIPVPGSISPEAQAALAMDRPQQASVLPALDDKAGWRAHISRVNSTWAPLLRAQVATLNARVSSRAIAGVPVFVAEPNSIPDENQDKALLYFHAGGLVILGGECTSYLGAMEAVSTRCRVFAVDYRNPPDHPYPAALDDCVAVYRELLNTYSAAKIVIAGTSGGGNLAAAVPLKIRDLGLPMPGAVGLFTPEVDLTESGDTFHTNRDIDVVLPQGLPIFNALYADGHDLRDPYLSPLFGNFAKGFPPTFIQTGTRDLFLSNSVRFHRALRRAGIAAELHVGEAMPHGGFGDAPEDRELREEFMGFLARTAHWAAP